MKARIAVVLASGAMLTAALAAPAVAADKDTATSSGGLGGLTSLGGVSSLSGVTGTVFTTLLGPGGTLGL